MIFSKTLHQNDVLIYNAYMFFYIIRFYKLHKGTTQTVWSTYPTDTHEPSLLKPDVTNASIRPICILTHRVCRTGIRVCVRAFVYIKCTVISLPTGFADARSIILVASFRVSQVTYTFLYTAVTIEAKYATLNGIGLTRVRHSNVS